MNEQTPSNINMVKSNESLRNVALILLTIASVIMITLVVKDFNAFYNGTFTYTFIILIFIFAVFSYIISSFDGKSKSYIFMFLIIMMVVILSIILSLKVRLSSILSSDYFSNSILFCIFLFALVIFYYLFLEKFVNKPGWIPFLIKFIFYIPCTISDGIKYLIQDFYSTKTYVFYLLFIEFILITIYFYFYPRLQDSVYDNGVILLKYQEPLNTEKRIDYELYKSFANIKPLPGSKIEIRSPIRHTYSLSMWIFLNNQPLTQYAYTKETTIFAYLDTSGNPHPKITYKNDKNGLDQYIIYLSNTKTHGISLPHQKWNNLVFNYRDLYVDIFINGNLEVSIRLNELPTYTNRDTITIGEDGINDRTGLYGSICNVVYYKNIMTKGQIIDNYNLLSIRTPPVN